jgi:predicted TIM-barrel fold metal-dependent hydrolase
MLTRRAVLAALPALGISAGGGTPEVFAADAKKPVVDTHLHCFAGANEPRFPYHPDGPYQPTEASPPEHLLELMSAAEVDYAIVVHPEPYQDDHRYLEHCLSVGQGKLVGTCLFFAGRPNVTHDMRALVEKCPIVAARVHAYNPERLPPFGKPELRGLWKLAGDLGLAMQLHFEPRYAPGFEDLIREFSSVRVLVDHLGRPFQGTPKEHAVVVGWAKFDNVAMKLSSIPTHEQYPHRDPTAVVHELAAAFGAERLMYGGGYGPQATPESYRAERERTAALLAEFSEADRAKVLGGNAVRFFGLGSRF